jgi:hypothetical protein
MNVVDHGNVSGAFCSACQAFILRGIDPVAMGASTFLEAFLPSLGVGRHLRLRLRRYQRMVVRHPFSIRAGFPVFVFQQRPFEI